MRYLGEEDHEGMDCVYQVSSYVHEDHGRLVSLTVLLPWEDTTGPLATLVVTPTKALELAVELARVAGTVTI